MPTISKPTGILESPITVVEKLATKFKIDNNTHCWVWINGTDKFGYGQFSLKANGEYRTRRAHRVVLELVKGYDISKTGLVIDHLCRNTSCVNPKHLELVTGYTNVMRGVGASATNLRKTHCKRGHEFSDENIYTNPKGNRECRICKVMHLEASRAKYPGRPHRTTEEINRRLKELQGGQAEDGV